MAGARLLQGGVLRGERLRPLRALQRLGQLLVLLREALGRLRQGPGHLRGGLHALLLERLGQGGVVTALRRLDGGGDDVGGGGAPEAVALRVAERLQGWGGPGRSRVIRRFRRRGGGE